MRRSRRQVDDTKFERERRGKYRGAARITLDVLDFPEEQPTTLDRENVEYLKEVFRREHCRRQPIRNHVLVLIDQSCLGTALGMSGISAAALLTTGDEYPELRLPAGARLECLHGKHRIQAGREFLSPRDKWWIAELYLADLSPDVRQCLIEEYSNEKVPSDGEIYCKIRQYHFQRNLSFESRWWARLRGCRARNLKALLKHAEFTAAFDALLDVPGLWGGMQLTTLHKILALKSDDEILNYLEHIRQFWHDLVDGDVSAMRKIDCHTVDALELRAPGASTFDAEGIQSKLAVGKIFSAFNDHDRMQIFHRLCQYDSLIPSVNTFFRNLPYWEACVESVRHLTTVSRRDTVFTAFERQFTAVNQQDGQVVVQVDESSFMVTPGSYDDQIELGYRHIVASAMRHFVEVPREPVKKDVTVRPRLKADQVVLRRFAGLAIRLGFESPEIHELLRNGDDLESPARPASTKPPLVTSGPGETLQRRCGLPVLDTFQEDREFLFLPYLHDDQVEHGEGITSLFVLKAIYLAFLGPPEAKIALFPLQEREQRERERQRERQREQQGHWEREQEARLEQARREQQERKKREQLEKEHVKQIEQARREQEQREQEQREQGQREQGQREQEQREQEQREQEQREQEQREREQREREQREREQREREQPEQERREQGQRERQREEREREQRLEQEARQARGTVCIHFKIRENNVWRDVQTLWVDRSDASEVARLAKKSMRKGLRTLDTNGQLLAPNDIFDTVMADGTNTIILMPQRELDIDDRTLDSANVLGYEAIVENERQKRQAR